MADPAPLNIEDHEISEQEQGGSLLLEEHNMSHSESHDVASPMSFCRTFPMQQLNEISEVDSGAEEKKVSENEHNCGNFLSQSVSL